MYSFKVILFPCVFMYGECLYNSIFIIPTVN